MPFSCLQSFMESCRVVTVRRMVKKANLPWRTLKGRNKHVRFQSLVIILHNFGYKKRSKKNVIAPKIVD